jgi:glycosyltransferase 2 family protein
VLNGKKFDKVLFLIVSTILFYVALLIISDINLIFEKLYQIKLEYFLLVFGLMAGQLIFLGIKYHRLLKKLDIDISLKNSILIYLSGLTLIATPGGIGTAIKSQILKRKFDQPFGKTLPVIFIERFTELIAILIILTFFLIWNQMYESIIVVVIGYCFIIIMYAVSSNTNIFTFFKKLFLKIKKFEKFITSFDTSRDSFSKLFEFKTLGESVFWSIIAKISQLLAAYFIFQSLGINLDLILSGQIYYTSLVLGSLTFLPSGLIVTESSMIGLLLNHGIDLSLASLSVIVIRLVTTWLGTLVGIVAIKSIGTRNYKNSNN